MKHSWKYVYKYKNCINEQEAVPWKIKLSFICRRPSEDHNYTCYFCLFMLSVSWCFSLYLLQLLIWSLIYLIIIIRINASRVRTWPGYRHSCQDGHSDPWDEDKGQGSPLLLTPFTLILMIKACNMVSEIRIPQTQHRLPWKPQNLLPKHKHQWIIRAQLFIQGTGSEMCVSIRRQLPCHNPHTI